MESARFVTLIAHWRSADPKQCEDTIVSVIWLQTSPMWPDIFWVNFSGHFSKLKKVFRREASDESSAFPEKWSLRAIQWFWGHTRYLAIQLRLSDQYSPVMTKPTNRNIVSLVLHECNCSWNCSQKVSVPWSKWWQPKFVRKCEIGNK